MLSSKYIKEIKTQINSHFNKRKVKVFIFGSSLINKNFKDIDIGLMGYIKKGEANSLKASILESTLPYFVDVVDFKKVTPDFKKNVLENKILWIRH